MSGLSIFCSNQHPHQGLSLFCFIQHPHQRPLNMLHSASTSGASQYSGPFSINNRGLSLFYSVQHPHQGPLNILLHSASTSEALNILLHSASTSGALINLLHAASTSGASQYSAPFSFHIKGLLTLCSIQHPHEWPLNILLQSASTSGASQHSALFSIHIRGLPFCIHIRGLSIFWTIQHPHEGPRHLVAALLTPTNPQDARSVPRRLMKQCQHCKEDLKICNSESDIICCSFVSLKTK